MNRRSFLGTLVGGVAASAAVRTWPFRVYSFPSEIKTAQHVWFGPGGEIFQWPPNPIADDWRTYIYHYLPVCEYAA
jgi:hypothetical protein